MNQILGAIFFPKSEGLPWVRNQVSLELSKIHIESPVKPQGGGDGGDNLANKTVEVGIGWSLNIKVATTDVIDGLIVNHERTVRMFKRGVSGEDGVVRLHHSCRYLRSGVDGELELGLLPVVHGEPLHEKRCEARSSSSSK